MSNGEKQVKLRIVAKDETHGAFASAKAEAESLKRSVGGVFDAISSHWRGLLALVAGGALFKEAITSSMEWTSSVVQLSKRLGITTQDASGLNIALHHVGLEVDDYAAVAQKMTKQLRANEDGFHSLGIQTKESNGEWRNTKDVLTDAVEKLNGMKAGTDRNIASQVLFGARVGNLTALLRLNKDMLAESAEKAEKYHLLVGPDGAAKVLAYKGAMADLKLVGESVNVSLGNALLPTLLDLGTWLGTNGPTVAGAFITVLKVIRSVVEVLMVALESFWTIGTNAFFAVGTAVGTMGASLSLVAHGQFGAAKTAITDGLKEIQTLADGTKARLNELQQGDGLKDIWKDHPLAASAAPGGNTLGGGTGKEKDEHKEYLKQLREEVAELTKGAELGTLRYQNIRRLWELQQQLLAQARDPRTSLEDRNATQAAANALDKANPLGSAAIALAGPGAGSGKLANITGVHTPGKPDDIHAQVKIGDDIAAGFGRAGDAINVTRASIGALAHDIGDTARTAIDNFAGSWGDAAQSIASGAQTVGQALSNATRRAIGDAVSAKGSETLLDASKAFALGFKDPSQFLVAAKLFAIGTGYKALAGVLGGGGGGGGGIVGGGSGGGLSPNGFQQSTTATQNLGKVTVVWPSTAKSVLNINDPDDQLLLVEFFKKLQGNRDLEFIVAGA